MGGFVREGSSNNYVLLGGGGHKPVNDFMVGNNGHDYVEIGGLKWATMNIGASKVTDPGLYYQWGDITGYTALQCGTNAWQKQFEWADYKYGNGTMDPSSTNMIKYNASDGKVVLDISDDIARRNWGGSWRMPTREEYVALGNAVNTSWTTDYQGSGVSGLVCSAKTDSSKVLFFPAAGYCGDGSVVNDVGDAAFCWSSSIYTSFVPWAYTALFLSHSVDWGYATDRSYGFSVRGVIG